MRRFVGGIFLAAAALGARAERATFDGAPWASRQLFLGAISPSPPSLQPPSVTGSSGAEHPDHYGADCDGRGPGHPLPPPVASPSSLRAGTGICTTTCFFASEAECFDGGPSSEFPRCAYGTDCVDCGARIASPPPPPHSSGMVHTNNCLSGGPGSKFAACAVGTDCIDCGPRVSMPSPPPRPPAGHLAPSLPPSSCSNPCFYTSNADCDHGGFGCLICAYGTDCTSCREHPPSHHEHTSRRHERPPRRAVVSTPCAVESKNRAIMTTIRAEHIPQRILLMTTIRTEPFPCRHEHHPRRHEHRKCHSEPFTSPPPSMPPPKSPPCWCCSDSGLTPPPATLPPHPTSPPPPTSPPHPTTCSHTQRPDEHGETWLETRLEAASNRWSVTRQLPLCLALHGQSPSGGTLFDASFYLPMLAGHAQCSSSSSLGAWPTDVVHTQRVFIVCAGDVVAEVVGALPFEAALIPASWDHLLAPDGVVAALCDHVILDAKEQMRDQRPTDAIVPGLWMLGQCLAPDLAHVLDVMRVVHVQPWQLVATLVDLEGLEIDAESLGAWRPLDAAFAAQDTRCGSERSTEGLLALCFGVLDKGCPVDLIKPLANAAVVHGPGLVLREQSAPPLSSLHILGRSAKGDALLASEAEQQQVILANHRGAITSSLKGSASRSDAPAYNLVAPADMVWCLLAFWQGLLSFLRLFAFRWRLLMFWTAAAYSIHGNPRQLVLWGCMLLLRSLMAWLYRFAKPLCTRHRPREEHGLHVALTLLALYSMLPCTKASDAPSLYSVQTLPSHRRELQTAVSTSAGLIGALANTTVSHIVLAPGTYYLSAELSITRSVILEAAVSGTVVLNAQASSSSQRRVLLINPGSSGVVQLIRLNITGGYINSVCALRSSKLPIAPMGKLLTCLPQLTLAQLWTLWSTTGGECCRDLEKFPSPPWETHGLLVVCRAAAVSLSRVAQCQL